MLYKTAGIALSYIKFRESSIIVRILTERFGLQSYIVNGARSAKARGKMALFQPLTLLDLVVYHKGDGKISRISELKCAHPFMSIPFDQKKISIALFLAEVLEKTLKEEEENIEQFGFIRQSLLHFDGMNAEFENFHLQFLLQLSRYLGFFPDSKEDFYREARLPSISTDQEEALDLLLEDETDYGSRISNGSRRLLLSHILDFYHAHLEGIGTIRSLPVLQTVLQS
jgi:DNA repair protein RecO (recombination protein O)